MKAIFVSEALEFDRDEKNILSKIGIGISFLNIKPGTILKAKKEVWIGPRTGFSQRGVGTKIWEENYVVVIDWEKLPSGHLKVWYYQNWDLDQAKTVRNNIDTYTRGYSMTGSIKQFENRFSILER